MFNKPDPNITKNVCEVLDAKFGSEIHDLLIMYMTSKADIMREFTNPFDLPIDHELMKKEFGFSIFALCRFMSTDGVNIKRKDPLFMYQY